MSFSADHKEEKLSTILANFQTHYASNPLNLLNKIPPEEMWRFFIDGMRQNTGLKQQMITALLAADVLKPEDFKQTIGQVLKRIQSTGMPTKVIESIKYNYKLDENELFQTLVDMGKGWLSFEKTEKNYLREMMATFSKLNNTRSLASKFKLDANFIKEIHLSATSKVDSLNYDNKKAASQKKGQFRSVHNAFNRLTKSNSTAAGYDDILEFINKDKSQFPIMAIQKLDEVNYIVPDFIANDPEQQEFIKKQLLLGVDFKVNFYSVEAAKSQDFYKKNIHTEGSTFWLYNFTNKSENENLAIRQSIEQKIESYVNQFNENISKAKTKLEQLNVIIDFIQNCERTHPFYDGNTRTFSMLTLNTLLMQYQFPPAILTNPNYSIGYSKQEFLKEVISGMENTLNLASNKKLYDITTAEILQRSEEQQKYFNEQVLPIEISRRGSVTPEQIQTLRAKLEKLNTEYPSTFLNETLNILGPVNTAPQVDEKKETDNTSYVTLSLFNPNIDSRIQNQNAVKLYQAIKHLITQLSSAEEGDKLGKKLYVILQELTNQHLHFHIDLLVIDKFSPGYESQSMSWR